jgi:hypothetical protein
MGSDVVSWWSAVLTGAILISSPGPSPYNIAFSAVVLQPFGGALVPAAQGFSYQRQRRFIS